MSITTVFIIGAGAVCDLGMPVGSELQKRISKSLTFRRSEGAGGGELQGISTLSRGIQKLCGNASLGLGKGLEAARAISQGIFTKKSIDDFIDANRNENLISWIGKLAIVYEILKAERESKLMKSQSDEENIPVPDVAGVSDCGYLRLYQLITERCSQDDIPKRFESIGFVNFNYDRCLEQFLWAALIRNYSITPSRAAELVRGLRIIHPYGTVGGEPWTQSPGEVPYGGVDDYSKLLEISEGIKTYSEQAHGETAEEISSMMAKATHVVWLGFGFHDQNMELLLPEKNQASHVNDAVHFATAVGVSDFNCNEIRSFIEKRTKSRRDNIYIAKEVACAKLLEDYKKGLQFPPPA